MSFNFRTSRRFRQALPLGGTTAQRPAADTVPVGTQYYDTTIGKSVWSTGAAWHDAAGVAA